MHDQPLDERIQMLVPVVRGLAAILGPDCEVVLHDVSRLPHSIVAIENGALSGRSIGDGPTDRVLRYLRSSARDENVYLHMWAHEGRLLKSLTVTLRDHEGEPFCLLCLALDVTELIQAQHAIASVTRLGEASDDHDDTGVEIPNSHVRDVVDSMISEVVGGMGKPPAAMSRDEKTQVVKHLDARGAFLVKRSAEQIAEALDLSRYTIFSYLKEIRRGETRKHAES